MSERSRFWSITINNPTSSDDENIATAKSRGWKVEGQQETGESGTTHYQLMVDTGAGSNHRFAAIKKAFPRAHIEIARNPSALKQYVHKEETRTGQLPQSDYYPTSLSKYWELITQEILDTAKGIPLDDYLKDYRLDPLKLLDKMTSQLIYHGYHVETFNVNPQYRMAWRNFYREITKRSEDHLSSLTHNDRQTDNASTSSE